VDEVENVADVIYRLAEENQIPDLTQDQWKRLEFLYTNYETTKESIEKERNELQESFFQLARTPMPTKEALVAKQEEINRKDDFIDDTAILTALQIRSILTPKQLQAIFLVDFDKDFRRISLSAEQRKNMVGMAVAEKNAKDELLIQVTHLQYDLALLLGNPKPDEKAIFQKQDQINELQNKIADEDLKLKLKLRTVLDWQQKNRLFNSHRSDTFSAVGVTKETDGKLMDLHCRREAISDEGRQQIMDLGSQLMAKYQKAETTDQELIDLQKQIDKIADQTRDGESGIVAEIRTILTPQERSKLVELLSQEAKGVYPPFPPETEYHEHNMDHMSHEHMSGDHMEHSKP
jgi:hypothetical protein